MNIDISYRKLPLVSPPLTFLPPPSPVIRSPSVHQKIIWYGYKPSLDVRAPFPVSSLPCFELFQSLIVTSKWKIYFDQRRHSSFRDVFFILVIRPFGISPVVYNPTDLKASYEVVWTQGLQAVVYGICNNRTKMALKQIQKIPCTWLSGNILFFRYHVTVRGTHVGRTSCRPSRQI